MCFFVILISRLFLRLVLFIAGGRKNPWWGLKKSAGVKKIPPGGGKNNSAWIVHQYAGGKKTARFFLAPGGTE